MSNRAKKWIGVAALAALVCTAIVFAVRTGRPERVVRVGLVSASPFETRQPGARPAGLIVELIEEAARRKRMRIVWVDTLKGGEWSLDHGLVDVWPGMGHMPGRDRRFHITKPFLRKDFCLVSQSGHPLAAPPECIGKKVSLVDGPLTRILGEKFLPQADRQTAASRASAITALCRGEVEAAFSETSTFQTLLLHRPRDCWPVQFQMSPVPGAAIEMGLATRLADRELGDRLRDGIEGQRADGTFTRLLARWMPLALGENEVLFQEQAQRNRIVRSAIGLAGVAMLALLLLWHNRRVSRARQLTERANAALEASMAQLRGAHRRLRFQVDRMPLACIVWDKDSRVREWNPAAETIFGWTAAEAKGKTLDELVLPPAAESGIHDVWGDVARRGAAANQERENVARDGRRLICEWVSTPLRDDDGRMTDMLSLAHDVTERRQLEEELRQAHKLESIGLLAGGVAHDFNNLLTVINGYGDLMLKELARNHPQRESLEEIRKAGERAANLTHQLLAFSRKQILQPKPLDLNAELRENAPMFQQLLGVDIELVVRPGAELGQVMVDAGQLHQVLMNLLANARDAMPGGGKVTIATAVVHVNKSHLSENTKVTPGPFVELTVSDTGAGMDSATLEHIFEPFFTTKGRATATGLGLPMVHGVVSQSGGWIDVASEVGKGTAFRICLPQIDGTPAEAMEKAGAQALPPGNGTILLVADQPNVRKLTAAVLQNSGYTVLEVGSGPAAVALARQYPEPIDLLLTDVIMPGMKGPEVAAAVRQIRPAVAVLFMSGYGEDALAQHRVDAAEVAIVPKPFTPAGLIMHVQAALAANRPGPAGAKQP
jgi:PAS domain S-box-containing protein